MEISVYQALDDILGVNDRRGVKQHKTFTCNKLNSENFDFFVIKKKITPITEIKIVNSK